MQKEQSIPRISSSPLCSSQAFPSTLRKLCHNTAALRLPEPPPQFPAFLGVTCQCHSTRPTPSLLPRGACTPPFPFPGRPSSASAASSPQLWSSQHRRDPGPNLWAALLLLPVCSVTCTCLTALNSIYTGHLTVPGRAAAETPTLNSQARSPPTPQPQTSSGLSCVS